MLTRCPGCGKEIDESLDVCPHCKRDFSVKVQGTGRRVGPAGEQPNNPAQAKVPPPKPQPGRPPAPQQKKPPATVPRKPPPADDPPTHMKAAIGSVPGDEFLAPEDVQAAAASDDLPAFMKAELQAPPAAGADLPPHMMADISSPPGQEFDESALPPHMRGDALDSFTPRAPVEQKSNPLIYVGIGAVFVAGFVISRMLGGKPASVPEPVQKQAEAPGLPDPSVEVESEEPERSSAQDEAQKAAESAGDAKKNLPQLALDAPPIVEAVPPPIEEATLKNTSSRRPLRQARASAVIPIQDDAAPKAQALKHSKWRLRATLFNLITLAPIADAEVSLYDNQTGQRYPTATGPDGGFRKTLPANIPGYKVLFRHKDYETKYLPAEAHSFQSMSEEERREVASKLKQFTPEGNPLVGDGEGMIKTEFYLLPREKHGMSLEEALDR